MFDEPPGCKSDSYRVHSGINNSCYLGEHSINNLQYPGQPLSPTRPNRHSTATLALPSTFIAVAALRRRMIFCWTTVGAPVSSELSGGLVVGRSGPYHSDSLVCDSLFNQHRSGFDVDMLQTEGYSGSKIAVPLEKRPPLTNPHRACELWNRSECQLQ